MIARYIILFGLVAGVPGCDQITEKPRVTPPAASSAAERPSVVFLGTSLTAGLGLEPEQAYPALIQQKIDSAGLDYRVVNAGVSGETSAGARRRIDWLLREPVAVLVLQPAPRLVLIGMRVPPNYGRAYSQQFQTIYSQVARANGAELVPFLLEGVGGVAGLNQPDGIHPTAEGQRVMAETVWRVMEPLLREKA